MDLVGDAANSVNQAITRSSAESKSGWVSAKTPTAKLKGQIGDHRVSGTSPMERLTELNQGLREAARKVLQSDTTHSADSSPFGLDPDAINFVGHHLAQALTCKNDEEPTDAHVAKACTFLREMNRCLVAAANGQYREPPAPLSFGLASIIPSDLFHREAWAERHVNKFMKAFQEVIPAHAQDIQEPFLREWLNAVFSSPNESRMDEVKQGWKFRTLVKEMLVRSNSKGAFVDSSVDLYLRRAQASLGKLQAGKPSTPPPFKGRPIELSYEAFLLYKMDLPNTSVRREQMARILRAQDLIDSAALMDYDEKLLLALGLEDNASYRSLIDNLDELPDHFGDLIESEQLKLLSKTLGLANASENADRIQLLLDFSLISEKGIVSYAMEVMGVPGSDKNRELFSCLDNENLVEPEKRQEHMKQELMQAMMIVLDLDDTIPHRDYVKKLVDNLLTGKAAVTDPYRAMDKEQVFAAWTKALGGNITDDVQEYMRFILSEVPKLADGQTPELRRFQGKEWADRWAQRCTQGGLWPASPSDGRLRSLWGTHGRGPIWGFTHSL